jgi:pimeloyl-ACP methyl ester carboxylesterase
MLHVRWLASGGAVVMLSAFFVANLQAQEAGTAPGVKMVELDGHAVRVQVIGLDKRRKGSPVVVFEAGATNPLEIWGGILPQLAAVTPVIAYDRAGLGRSAWDGATPTPQHVANRLRRLLKQLGAEPPYVIVGYSWGGILARYFAGLHPRDVAGLVFVDPGPIVTQPLTDNLAAFNAIGAGQEGYDAYWSSFATLFEKRAPAARAEFGVFRRLMEIDPADRDLRPVPQVPIVVIVAAKYLPLPNMKLPYDPQAHFQADLRHRIRVLQEWALASPQGTLVMSNHATHLITREDPELIVWAVQRILSAVSNRR